MRARRERGQRYHGCRGADAYVEACVASYLSYHDVALSHEMWWMNCVCVCVRERERER
jgi:hypothetical protein